MQQKDGCIGGDGVEFLDGRQSLLNELMRGKPADDANPLWCPRHRYLALEHRHAIGEAAHAVPAQLHAEVRSAADNVEVISIKPGNTRRPRRSMIRVDGPASGMMSSPPPTAVNTPLLIAMALAVGFARSSVTTKPPCRRRRSGMSVIGAPR
jgi:hypothetical protein